MIPQIVWMRAGEEVCSLDANTHTAHQAIQVCFARRAVWAFSFPKSRNSCTRTHSRPSQMIRLKPESLDMQSVSLLSALYQGVHARHGQQVGRRAVVLCSTLFSPFPGCIWVLSAWLDETR